MNFSKYVDIFKNVAIGMEMEKDVTILYEKIYVEKNGFGAYVVEDNETECEFNISGNFPKPLIVGQSYNVKGVVDEYKKNKQLIVKSALTSKPKTEKGILTYLKTLNQISEKRAKLIFDKFGADSIDMLIKDPETVAKELPRVSEKLAKKWQAELKENLETQALMVKLFDYGLSLKEAKKLYDELGERVIDEIEVNPYILSRLVKGFGFEKCDKIARNVCISPLSPFRIQEGIIHALKQESTQGHCYLPIDELIEKSKTYLDIRLTANEMKKFAIEHQGKESFDYSVGKSSYNISYKKMMMAYSAYENEKSAKKKDNHRFVVLKFTDDQIDKEILELSSQFRVIMDDDKVYLKDIYRAELLVAKKVLELSEDDDVFTKEQVSKCLNEILKQKNIELEAMQEKACIEFNTNLGGFYILNGSAGTGKTFTLNLILETASKIRRENMYKPPKILAFAPTGKASKVASKSIGMPCCTIHKGLGFNPVQGFEHNEKNPFNADIIVCDEVSMLDIKLASYFLEAVKKGTKVIFMGDTKQLASVGAGNVLKDLVESNVVKVITLNVVKRQGLLSDIIKNANNIIEGKAIVNYNETKDAFFLPRQSYKNCHNTIIESIYRILKRGIEFNEIQVLSPQRAGSMGVYVLNYILQQEFNSGNNETVIPALKFKTKLNEREDEKEYTLYFKKNDKIINIRNDYDLVQYKKDAYGNLVPIGEKSKGITNGECGVIEKIEKISKIVEGKPTVITRMTVKYEDFYAMYDDEFNDLEHAYCLTIHKSQGSAWRAVLVPIVMAHYYSQMLDNNLIYTAWTRAREFAVAIGQEMAVQKGVSTSNAKSRYTTLNDRLQGKVGI